MNNREREDLQQSKARPFNSWLEESDVPTVAAGVYTIWKGKQLIYVGMSGRGWTEADIAAKRKRGERGKGLVSRLSSHASGHRSGDQFCVYICDRYVLPRLCRDLDKLDKANLSQTIDDLTRAFIREHLSYAFTVVKDGKTALALEREIKQGALGVKPVLNPG